MRHDIGKIIREVRAKYPPEKRTARNLLVLLEATRQARERSLRAIAARPAEGVPEDQRQQLMRDLKRLGARLDLYAVSLSRVAPSDPMPESVRPLFHNILWTPETPATLRHPTPDYTTPFKVDNAFGELGEFYSFQSDKFFEFLVDGIEDAGRATGTVVTGVVRGAAAATVGSGWPWVVGGLGVVALGGVVYLAATRR